MKVYNSLSKRVEEFIPHGDVVTMYTCGPTVYHYAHIGNLRTYIFEDILERTLLFLGYKVKRVMNITDIGHLEGDSDTGEDKMVKSAREEKKTVKEIADFYTKAFLKDIEKLNIKVPEIMEPASENIDTYLKIISTLIDKGYAYFNHNVYFDMEKAKDFLNYEYLVGVRKSNIKQDEVTDNYKKNPEDFALWFTDSKFKNQEMKWDSPWGYGYPGWHIECSGISLENLGEYLDIHCGGVDNIFPHHANEILQSEAYLGHPWCKYFIHGEHLNLKDFKMSKSLGNVLTLSKLEEEGYSPLDYRFFVLNSHYRKVLSFDFDKLDAAKNKLKSLREEINYLKEGKIDNEKVEPYIEKFKDALASDLNTSLAITTLYNTLKDNSLSQADKYYLVSKYDEVLKLDLIRKHDLDEELIKEVESLIEERNKYKKEGLYDKADEIRENLKNKGFILKDGRDKTTYQYIGGINEKE